MKFGIVFGAKSFEHEISIVSAIVLKNVLNHDMAYIFCDKEREFYLIDKSDMRVNFFSSGKYKKSKKLSLANGGFYTSGIFGNKKLDVSVFINLIHGADGEDGKMAALFDFYDISYIGPRLEASVMSYNKELTKLLAQKAGVKTLEYEIIKRGVLPTLKYPIILKPVRLGSSIGVGVVKDESELEYAQDVAFEFDNEVLVEPFIQGVKEYNLAGYAINGSIKFSMIEEPKKREFLDYEQKYLSFSNENKVAKAEISEQLEIKLKNSFEQIYACGFDGALIRCDFFVIDDEVYLNEINPNPGSLANYLFEDFAVALDTLAHSLPRQRDIKIDYKFINSITSIKGGAKIKG
ncbi:D-alanine--D-alanine ligase [Campylobacter sp. faydin G-24]|uniref:D-alanine--D-alanine ligase n=1 Tax=Campylobacter anatolicus TaxID=2829105 RepID=A0ABS5HIR9_9BACT|nr:D-alanine--D-alanine ligase [Campylobacter anatolicus]MBR8462836.1 D-alanine--D-alanine ligase [Campylobacter anatolicus]MBR8463910.1 D-alanine--D-alanine ligase [Campylobacter anatolicus]MBR8465858.1 D-alanine--D-alanine ligase [Campylobacter anatolicus]